jgi:hypothetical protein
MRLGLSPPSQGLGDIVATGIEPRGVNGIDNFHSKFAFTFIFKDMVCNYLNPTDTNIDMDIGHANIRRL